MTKAVWALAAKELRDQWWKAVLGAVVLLTLAAFLPWSYTMLPQVLGQSEMPKGLMEWLTRLLGSYPQYVWSNWFGKNLYQLLALFGLLFGISAVTPETARGTLHFLLAQPLGRRQVLAAKFSVSAALLTGLAVVPTLALPGLSAAFGRPLDAALIAKGLPAAVAGALVLLGVGVLLSVLIDEALKAIGVAVGVVFVLSLPSWFAATHNLSIFWAMAGRYTLDTGAVPWPAVAAMLALAAALYAAAAWALERKQL